MLGVLSFLLLTVGVVSLSVFLILWIVKAILKTPYSKKNYAIYSSASAAIVIISIILGITTSKPVERTSIDRFTEKGSEITGLKTSAQIAKEAEEAVLKDKEKKEAGEKAVFRAKDEAEKKDNQDKKTENKKKSQVAQKEKEESIEEKAKRIAYDIFEFGEETIDETVQEVIFDKDDNSLSIKVKGKDGWTEKSIGLGFYEDSTALYKELSNEEQLNEVWITITFPMKDVYGNIVDEEVMGTWMSRETMDKINWKSFNYNDLLDVVDGKSIYPQFVQ